MADSLLESWVGGRIQRVSQRGTDSVLIDLFHPDAPSVSRRSRWQVSAIPGTPGIQPSTEAHQNAPKPPIFCLWLRTRILNGRVVQWVRLHPRVHEVTVDRLKDERVQRFHLVHEDNGPDSNLLLLDADRMLLAEDLRIVSVGMGGARSERTLGELLPEAFAPDDLRGGSR